MDWIQVVLFVVVMLWYIFNMVKGAQKKRPRQDRGYQEPVVPKPAVTQSKKRVQTAPIPQVKRIERRSVDPQKVQKKPAPIKKLIGDLPSKKSLVLLSEILKRKY